SGKSEPKDVPPVKRSYPARRIQKESSDEQTLGSRVQQKLPEARLVHTGDSSRPFRVKGRPLGLPGVATYDCIAELSDLIEAADQSR
ncbi:MAG TPA: hypothetical protein PKJ41_17645, partial [Bryobacteraceae bacterium]|nr:hypothetical protein [Bryobacteraceae bacterium]